MGGVVGATAVISVATAQEQRTVWDGLYTEAQAVRGEGVYQDECAFCHLDDLQGDGFATPLIEDAFAMRWQDGTLADLLTIVKVTMPADRPATLTDQAVADVVAFLLEMNDYPPGPQELDADPTGHEDVVFTKP